MVIVLDYLTRSGFEDIRLTMTETLWPTPEAQILDTTTFLPSRPRTGHHAPASS